LRYVLSMTFLLIILVSLSGCNEVMLNGDFDDAVDLLKEQKYDEAILELESIELKSDSLERRVSNKLEEAKLLQQTFETRANAFNKAETYYKNLEYDRGYKQAKLVMTFPVGGPRDQERFEKSEKLIKKILDDVNKHLEKIKKASIASSQSLQNQRYKSALDKLNSIFNKKETFGQAAEISKTLQNLKNQRDIVLEKYARKFNGNWGQASRRYSSFNNVFITNLSAKKSTIRLTEWNFNDEYNWEQADYDYSPTQCTATIQHDVSGVGSFSSNCLGEGSVLLTDNNEVEIQMSGESAEVWSTITQADISEANNADREFVQSKLNEVSRNFVQNFNNYSYYTISDYAFENCDSSKTAVCSTNIYDNNITLDITFNMSKVTFISLNRNNSDISDYTFEDLKNYINNSGITSSVSPKSDYQEVIDYCYDSDWDGFNDYCDYKYIYTRYYWNLD
jgi:hypothetical protein